MTEPQSAGATPVAGGATPPQTPATPAPATPAVPPASATDDDAALGDAGKRAIDRMKAERDAALAAQRTAAAQLEELQNATRTDAEKAIAQAKKDGAAEVLAKAHGQIRRSEVRASLIAAGVAANVVDLASRADEFAELKVSDDGEVQGLDQAIDAFKKAMPDLFKAQAPNSGRPVDFGGGPRGTAPGAGRDMNTLIRAAAGRG